MGFFGAVHGWQKAPPPSLKPVTHPEMMKLGTAIPYPSSTFHRGSGYFAKSKNTDID